MFARAERVPVSLQVIGRRFLERLPMRFKIYSTLVDPKILMDLGNAPQLTNLSFTTWRHLKS